MNVCRRVILRSIRATLAHRSFTTVRPRISTARAHLHQPHTSRTQTLTHPYPLRRNTHSQGPQTTTPPPNQSHQDTSSKDEWTKTQPTLHKINKYALLLSMGYIYFTGTVSVLGDSIDMIKNAMGIETKEEKKDDGRVFVSQREFELAVAREALNRENVRELAKRGTDDDECI